MIQVKKALVVDDSRLARIALSKLLQRRNVDVDTVATGTEALDYLRTTRPDVVFMDYMMPDMDGFEATRRIRSLPGEADIPVIMYTAQENEEDRERAEALGIAGFLTKPSGEDSLEEILQSLGRLPHEPGAAPVANNLESSGAMGQEQSIPVAAQPVPVPPVVQSEPTVTRPAPVSAPQGEPPRPAASQDIRTIAIEAIRQLVEQQIESLRKEVEATIHQAIDASQAATNGLAEKTARRVAADSVREAIEHLGDERGPAAEKKNKAELHRELRGHVAELLAADVFRHQFTDIVLETALPRLRDELTEEMLSHMREHSLEDTRRVAQEVSWDTAAKAARDATSEQIAVSLTEYQMQANDRVRHLIQASAAELRRSLSICAGIGLALIIAGVIASVYLSTHGISF